MNIGKPEISLKVLNLKYSLALYESLGFRRVEGNEDEKWLVLEQTGIRIGLYEGLIEKNSIAFFGGDVEAIAATRHESGPDLQSGSVVEEDGPLGAKVMDPDDNHLYLSA